MDSNDERARAFKDAVTAGDAARLRTLFAEHPDLPGVIDAPWFSFGKPALAEAAGRLDRDMVDALLEVGADPDARSDWEAGPYSALHTLLDGATPQRIAFAEYLVSRGATVDLHSAAGLGRLDRIEEILDAAPERVSAPGPDGATPLHLARSPEVAALLLDRGAEIDKRCVDHSSTPAMWAAGGREDVMRFLLERGATPDLFQAVLLDDQGLADTILARDPAAISVRVRFGRSHPHLGGGDKYVWALDGADTPLELARRREARAMEAYLWERAPLGIKVVHASRGEDEAALAELLAEKGAVDTLSTDEVFLGLCGSASGAGALTRAGADPSTPDPGNGSTPLHHAGWNGDLQLARTLLEAGADPTVHDGNHDSTPLGWADFAGHEEVVRLIEGYLPD
ncbi:MAG: ankyrin repeat domain-containing protein [Gemmatimonadetes bacterium]|nr:ankyrin repeat domain-containing protein [Gemmatimonadota bacterium]